MYMLCHAPYYIIGWALSVLCTLCKFMCTHMCCSCTCMCLNVHTCHAHANCKKSLHVCASMTMYAHAFHQEVKVHLNFGKTMEGLWGESCLASKARQCQRNHYQCPTTLLFTHHSLAHVKIS